MKSTKAMEIEDSEVLVQVSTQQGDNVAEAIVFIPNAHVVNFVPQEGIDVKSRFIVINDSYDETYKQ